MNDFKYKLKFTAGLIIAGLFACGILNILFMIMDKPFSFTLYFITMFIVVSVSGFAFFILEPLARKFLK